MGPTQNDKNWHYRLNDYFEKPYFSLVKNDHNYKTDLDIKSIVKNNP